MAALSRMEQPGVVCQGEADRSMRAGERRHDLGGEPPDALPGGLSAVKQEVPDADRAQGFELGSDAVGRAVQRAGLSRARCVGIGHDVRSIAPVRVLRLSGHASVRPR